MNSHDALDSDLMDALRANGLQLSALIRSSTMMRNGEVGEGGFNGVALDSLRLFDQGNAVACLILLPVS